MQARRSASEKPGTHSDTRLRATRHRLVVEAENVLDAVTAAGGLIFDRASAGWWVDVRLTACEDDRPLRILGVAPMGLDDDLAAEEHTPDALIVAAGMLQTNDAASTRFFAAAKIDATELAVWGGEWPQNLEQRTGLVELDSASAPEPSRCTRCGPPEDAWTVARPNPSTADTVWSTWQPP